MGTGASCRGDLVEAGPDFWGPDPTDREGLEGEGRVGGHWMGTSTSVDGGQLVSESPETEKKQPIRTKIRDRHQVS